MPTINMKESDGPAGKEMTANAAEIVVKSGGGQARIEMNARGTDPIRGPVTIEGKVIVVEVQRGEIV